MTLLHTHDSTCLYSPHQDRLARNRSSDILCTKSTSLHSFLWSTYVSLWRWSNAHITNNLHWNVFQEREEMQEEFLNKLWRIAFLRTSSWSSDKLLAAAISHLKKTTTSSGADTILLMIKLAGAVDRRHGRQIKVQPTSLARHRPDLPRGSAFFGSSEESGRAAESETLP